jgi:sugar phosphate isomerase/epimerase
MFILLNSIALDPNRWTADKIPHIRLFNLLEPIAETGFKNVEVWQQHVLLEEIETVVGIKDAGDKLGVTFPIVGAYPKLHLIGQDRQQEIDKLVQLVKRARILGAKVVKIFVGSKGSEELNKVEYERSVAFLGQLVTLADEHGLTVTGEMHKKTLFDSVASTLHLMESIASDKFGVCFQPYDFGSTDQAVLDFISVAGNTLHVHFQGKKNGRLDYLEHSDINYARLTKELISHSFNGYLCIEFVKDCVVKDPDAFNLATVLDNAKQDKKYIARILDHNGVAYS